MQLGNDVSDLPQVATYGEMLLHFPCFSHLTLEQASELVHKMQEIFLEPGAIITKENDLVDSIYLIVKGEAEVLHEIKKGRKQQKIKQVPVAVLQSGEAIGLNDTGFYSLSGKRTATVQALSKMKILKLDVNDLYQFLSHSNLETSMYAATQEMLRMRFIKQSLPFSKLSHERLRWLAQQVQEESFLAGDIIFKQGEMGDKCYLIRSGKIGITVQENDAEHPVAVLKPPVIFGEATLITHSPRNATARALDDCQLLILKHSQLSELIESEQNVSRMFMTLMVDRSKPLRNPNVTLHQRTTADGQIVTILKNTENNSYFKLSNEGSYIWEQLDGNQTMQDITLALAEKFNVFAPDVVAALISKLSKAGFIHNLDINDMQQNHSQPFWIKAVLKVRSILEFRYAFGDSDGWITKIYNSYMRYLFTKPGQIILAVLIIAGMMTFAKHTPAVIDYFNTKHTSLLLILSLIPLGMLEVLLHELGHAFAVKAFGREVHYIGIGLYWLAPIAFTDTSDMWLSNRKHRMLVNIAGIYVDLLVAGVCALAMFVFHQPIIQALLWLFALYTYIGALRMLSPLQEMDGYYILMDWVEKPKLRQAAVVWLVKIFPKCMRQPSLFKQYKPEVTYWLACLAYLFILSLVTLKILSYAFAIIGIHSNQYLSLAIPVLVVVLSSLTVIADIRQQAEE